jgi:hypothetical protein
MFPRPERTVGEKKVRKLSEYFKDSNFEHPKVVSVAEAADKAAERAIKAMESARISK